MIMTAKIIQFPKCLDDKCCPTESPEEDLGPYRTVIISDSVYSAPPEAFKWPSAGPVDSKYVKALEEQKRAKAKP